MPGGAVQNPVVAGMLLGNLKSILLFMPATTEMTARLLGAIGGVDGGRGSGNEGTTLKSSGLAQVHEG